MPSQRAVDPGDREFLRLRDERLHERLVELDDVGAGLLQVVQLLVHRLGIGHQQRARIAIVLVLGEPHHGERARHRDLDRPVW